MNDLNSIYLNESEFLLRLKMCQQHSGEEILNIIVAASEFYLQNLVEHLKEYLCTNRREILQSNPLELLVLSFQHESLFSLQEMIIKLICQKPKVIFNTRYFYCLPPNVLETLIKREDLILDEIIIWENLVKWCIYQCKYFENEKDIYKINLSDEEFNNIKETLENYIYLINFQEISARDFLNKVMPYEELLPRELKKDILRYHMLPGIESPDNSSPVNTPEPSQSPTPSLSSESSNSITSIITYSYFPPQPPHRKMIAHIDSNLINYVHVTLFATWIDKKSEMYNDSKSIIYEFNLLFRSSRDGTYGNTFHKKCDKKGPTIVIAKIKDSKALIGGYNPMGWEGDCIKSTVDSFLFSFNDSNNVGTGRIGRVIRPKGAIRCFKGWGPIFGNLNGDSNDLAMTSLGNWSSSSGSYENVGIPNHFKVEEWEVFQIKKKKEYELLGI
ncbi:11924_t:CDS:2 [Funneliformis geosporum]|nr:11924_t:CDS:2 [Funneliformis geosporum]